MFYRINHANTCAPPLREKEREREGRGKTAVFLLAEITVWPNYEVTSPQWHERERRREGGKTAIYIVHLRQLHLVINWRRLLGKPYRQSGVLLTETYREVHYSRRKLAKRKPCDGLNADQVTTRIYCFVKWRTLE